jgi:hypothetical protein
MARAIRMSARSPGVFSRRDSVDCEQREASSGPPVGELEQRIVAQAVGIIAILIAGGEHQQAAAQHLGKAVLDAFGRARIVDAFGEAPRHAEALPDLTQRKQAAIGGERAAVEAGEDPLAGDR